MLTVQWLIPQGLVVIVLSAVADWGNSGGGIEADFDSAGYEAMCPFVEVQVVA